MVKVGRQRSSPWPVGYGPRFLPGSREDGRRNTMRLELSRRPARRQTTEDSETGTCGCLFWRTRASFFLNEVYTVYIYACGGVLILPCLSKASGCRYLGCGAFSPWESCRPRARRYWVPGYPAGFQGLRPACRVSVWANQNLIRHDDQQQPSKQKSSLPAKPPQGSKSPSSLLLAALPQLRPSNRGIN